MTDYAAMAQQHWMRWLPQRYSQIPEPRTEFFRRLGEQVELEIADLTEELAGPDQPGETYLARVGRLNNAAQRAREMILPDQILLAPEPGTDPDTPTGPRIDPGIDVVSASSLGVEIPWVVTRDDPQWQQIVDEEDQARETLGRGGSGRAGNTTSRPRGNAPG